MGARSRLSSWEQLRAPVRSGKRKHSRAHPAMSPRVLNFPVALIPALPAHSIATSGHDQLPPSRAGYSFSAAGLRGSQRRRRQHQTEVEQLDHVLVCLQCHHHAVSAEGTRAATAKATTRSRAAVVHLAVISIAS